MIYDVFHLLLEIKELYPDLEISSLPLHELEHLIKNTDIPERNRSFPVLFPQKTHKFLFSTFLFRDKVIWRRNLL